MRAPALAVAFCIAANLCAASVNGAPSIQAALEKAVAEKQVPGAVVVVERHGRIIIEQAAGYAVIETGRKMRTDDIFMMASSSKPLAATTILTLVDHGKLKLDDQVAKYFPEFQGSSTIRQLLSHTSGIFGNDGSPDEVQWIRNFDRSLADSVAGIVRLPLLYPPGTRYSYSGAGFCVAGRIAEIVSGTDFERYMDVSLWQPLGMRESFYRTSRDFSDRIPQIYKKTAEGFEPVPAIMQPPGRRGPRDSGFVLVPGGIYSTAHDLIRFLEMHLHGGAFAGKQILSSDLIAEMHRKQTGNLDTQYGLGWSLENGGAFGHGGAYGTEIWVDPRRDLVGVILTQELSAQAQPLIREIKAKIEEETDSER